MLPVMSLSLSSVSMFSAPKRYLTPVSQSSGSMVTVSRLVRASKQSRVTQMKVSWGLTVTSTAAAGRADRVMVTVASPPSLNTSGLGETMISGRLWAPATGASSSSRDAASEAPQADRRAPGSAGPNVSATMPLGAETYG